MLYTEANTKLIECKINWTFKFQFLKAIEDYLYKLVIVVKF